MNPASWKPTLTSSSHWLKCNIIGLKTIFSFVNAGYSVWKEARTKQNVCHWFRILLQKFYNLLLIYSLVHHHKDPDAAGKSSFSYTSSTWPHLSWNTTTDACGCRRNRCYCAAGRRDWQTPGSALNKHEWTKINDCMQIHPKRRDYDSKQAGEYSMVLLLLLLPRWQEAWKRCWNSRERRYSLDRLSKTGDLTGELGRESKFRVTGLGPSCFSSFLVKICIATSDLDTLKAAASFWLFQIISWASKTSLEDLIQTTGRTFDTPSLALPWPPAYSSSQTERGWGWGWGVLSWDVLPACAWPRLPGRLRGLQIWA